MDGMGRLERLVEFCKLLYSVSKIPIHIFDEQSMIYSCPDLEPLNKMEIARPVREELMSSAKKKPLLETFNSVVLYACIHFEERKDYYIFLGPALLNEPSRFDIRSLYPLFTYSSPEQIFSAIKYISVHDASHFIRYVQLLYLEIYGKTISLSNLLVENKELFSRDGIERDLENNYFAQQELTSAPLPYEYEQMICECVSAGDPERLKKLLAVPLDRPAGAFLNNPLRRAKNMMIAISAVIARAAIEGGLNIETASRLSDVYIQRAENCTEIKDVSILSVAMLMDFAERVAKEHHKEEYSEPIAQCLQYIGGHLHYELSLQVLSAYVHLSPRYLSRMFKEETGMSVIAYIQRERVREAQNLLRFSDQSYLEISNFLNFVSQSYFIKVFKKYTGMTPQQYRKKYCRLRLPEEEYRGEGHSAGE